MSTEDGEVLWLDEELDVAGGTRRSSDEADTFEGEDHLVDGWRTDTEVSLQVSFSRRPAEDARICVDECQILTLLRRETWNRRRRHRYIVYAGVMCGAT